MYTNTQKTDVDWLFKSLLHEADDVDDVCCNAKQNNALTYDTVDNPLQNLCQAVAEQICVRKLHIAGVHS